MIRVALPTGDLRKQTAAMLDASGAGIADYGAGSRALRFSMLDAAAIARVFRERDIPVQVALGNYDIGICSLTWVEELTQRFPGHEIVKLRDLGFGAQSLWLAAAGDTTEAAVRIASADIASSRSPARPRRTRRKTPMSRSSPRTTRQKLNRMGYGRCGRCSIAPPG